MHINKFISEEVLQKIPEFLQLALSLVERWCESIATHDKTGTWRSPQSEMMSMNSSHHSCLMCSFNYQVHGSDPGYEAKLKKKHFEL